MIRMKASVGLKHVTSRTAHNAQMATIDMNAQMKQVIKNYERVLSNIDLMLPQALESAMRPIFDESQVLVPKDTLRLMKSGFLSTGSFRGKPSVNIGYALGGKPDYAVMVHEDLYANHANGTSAKYLDIPLKRQMNDVPRRVAAAMREGMK